MIINVDKKIQKFLTVFKLMTGISAVIITALLISSCPTAIDDELLIQVEDSFQPSIIITSPIDDSYYYSTITINGTITDSAITASDGVGLLSSISYTVANDVLRQGRIIFTDDGFYTKDPSFGSGDIIFDAQTRSFNIVFSTIEVDSIPSILQQNVTITITAIDKNNNSSTKTVRLLENDGPYINLVEPGTTVFYFKDGTPVVISGFIGNSYFDQNNADEIESLLWRVSNQSWSGSLDLTAGSSDFNGTIYTTDNIALQFSNPFTYDPATREFGTSFDLPYGEFSVIPIEIRATDRNNHTTSATFNMYTNEAGPAMTFTLPVTATGIYNDGSDFYVNSDIAVLPNLNLVWVVDSDGPLVELGYSLTPNETIFDNSPDINNSPITILGTAIGPGKLYLTIRAVNDESKESRYYFVVRADDTAPAITINNYYAVSSGNYYAKPGDMITLDFSTADAGPVDAVSGVLTSSDPTVIIEGVHPTPVSAGLYQYPLPPYVSDFEKDIEFSIIVSDNVGNITSNDQTDAASLVKYYSGAFSLNTISIKSNNASPDGWAILGDTITLKFTSPRDLLSDPTVTIAGNSPDSLSHIGNIYTAVYTMDAGDTEVAIPYVVDFKDAAGNDGNSVNTASGIIYDKTAPTLTSIVMNDYSLIAGQTTPVTFTFSEAVTGFAALDDITAGNGAVTGLSSADGNITFTAMFTPSNNVEDLTNMISVADSTFTDPAGNDGTGNNTLNYTMDTKAPTLTSIVMGDYSLIEEQTTPVTFTFSEAVTGFVALDDITAGNGTVTGLSSADGNITFTATFTPTVNSESSGNVITVGDLYTDAVGNNGTGAVSASYEIDTKAPTLTSIIMNNYSLIAGQTTEVTFNFSEAVTGFVALDDITAGNGTVTDLSSSDGNITFTATFTPSNNVEDPTNIISVADNVYTDLAGNDGTGNNTLNYTIDTIVPVVPTVNSLATNNTAPTITGTAIVGTGEFLSVTVDSVPYLVDGLILSFTEPNWSLVIPVGSELLNGTYEVTATTTDSAGNASPDATLNELEIDIQAPTLETIVIDDADLKIIGATTVTFTFSEAVTGFAAEDDITAGNGTVTGLSSLDGNITFTATFTPTVNNESSGNVITVGDVYTDAVGNNGTGAVSANYEVDTIAPTLDSIVLDDTSFAIGNPASTEVTFTFSEEIQGFILIDINEGNGTVSDMNASNNPVITVTFTPDPNNESTGNIISVDDNSYQDLAGNNGTGKVSANYEIDTKAPTLDTIDLNDYSLIIGDTATVTFTFSEPVTGFVENSIQEGTASTTDLLVTADTKVYTATLTPTDNREDNSNTVSVAVGEYTDAMGNSNTTSTDSPNYIVDTIEPTPRPTVDSLTTDVTTPEIIGTTGNDTMDAGEFLSVTVNSVTYLVGDDLSLNNNDWSLIIPVELAVGTYEVLATITDSAGNTADDDTSDELEITN